MTQSDIYFSGDDAHAFLPWIVGIMACMATLLLCLGVTVGGWVTDRSGDYANGFTVNIPAGNADPAAVLAEVEKTLRAMPAVSRFAWLEEEKLREMLRPWLGQSASIDALPLPIVIEVATRAPPAKADYAALQAALDTVMPGIEIDARESWVTSFLHFSSAVRTAMALLAALILGGLAIMIAFTSRASLKLHARTVSLLHSIGAEDEYIMRQFQREAFLVTLRGTVPGCALALLAYWLAGLYMASLPASALPPLAVQPAHLAVLVAMPPAAAAIAWLTARFSVINQLRRVL